MDGPICDPWDDIELLMDVREALAQLTDKQREALVLWLAGYTQAEIGERLGVSRQAVTERIAGAIERIREMVGGEPCQNASLVSVVSEGECCDHVDS